MDMQALAARSQSYCYDGVYRARASLSAAQRAMFGLQDRSVSTRAEPPVAPAHNGPRHCDGIWAQRTHELGEASDPSQGAPAKRPPPPKPPVFADPATTRAWAPHTRRKLQFRLQPDRPHAERFLDVEFHTQTARIRCSVWRGRVFLSSTERVHADA
jgi:hypothetical protein